MSEPSVRRRRAHESQHDARTDDRTPKVKFPTRQIAIDLDDRNMYVDCSIKELFWYILFFVLLIVSCSGMYAYKVLAVDDEISLLFLGTQFQLTLESPALNYHNIYTRTHFWKYCENVLCEKLYGIYGGKTIDDKSTSGVLNNRLLYAPRIRQVRVKGQPCRDGKRINYFFDTCYAPYTIDTEDKSNFGSEKWNYSTDEVTQATKHRGKISNYGGGGYYFDFPKSKNEAISLLKNLQDKSWVDRGTRAIFVDFAIYNEINKIVSTVKLILECPAAGNIIATSHVKTAQVYNYIVADSLIVIAALTAVLVFFVYYTVAELFELAYFRLGYFTVFWNLIDLSIICQGWFCTYMIGLILITESKSKIKSTAASGEGYRFFSDLVDRHVTLMLMVSYLFFVACIKIIKYSDLTKYTTIIYLSMDRVQSFSTPGSAFESAMKILMRDFEFRTIELIDEKLMVMFFILLTFVVIYILLIMLVAIVSHAYLNLDVEELIGDRKHFVWDQAREDGLLRRIGFGKWAEKRKDDRMKYKHNYISYREARSLLKRCNFSDQEAEALLKRFDIEPQKTVHEDEAKQIFNDLSKKLKSFGNKDGTDGKTGNVSLVKRLKDYEELIANAIEEINASLNLVSTRSKSVRTK
ncbi:polycystin-2-like [Adelges cooleyi]|uniref:polycystin-2-like n=1 Tax=Adelges cooleyi TaxID=133065 RepID=UPI00217F2596|nr:polycystin-2-like [Adelges cooleyi]